MKNYAIQVNMGGGKWKPSTDPLIAKLPTLNAFLTDTWWEETKKPRKPCSLKIHFGIDRASIVLSDEANKMSITTTADTVGDALELLEEALAGGKVTWRPWGDFDRKKK